MADNAEHVRALNELRNRSKTDRSNACTEAQREIHTWRIAALDAAILALSPAAAGVQSVVAISPTTGQAHNVLMTANPAPHAASAMSPSAIIQAQPQDVVGDEAFIAQHFGDWWAIQVMCSGSPRSYAIRQADGALFELPDDRAPFVVFTPPAALHPTTREGQPDGR